MVSDYIQSAYDPETKTVRKAWWMDNYFSHHEYGIRFYKDGPVYRYNEVIIPVESVFILKEEEDTT